MEPSYQMSHSSSGQPLERTEKFYKRVIEKVMESSKKHFSENGVSDRVHEKLRQVWMGKLDDSEVYERNKKQMDSLKSRAMAEFNPDDSLENNKIPQHEQYPGGVFQPGNFVGIKKQSTLEPSSTSLGDIRSKMGVNYNPNSMPSAFQAHPGAMPSAFTPNSAVISHSAGSQLGENKVVGLQGGMMKPGLAASLKKKSKKESSSNKRTPAKVSTPRPEYVPKAYKNDGQDDDDEGEEDEEEGDEEEEDPDLLLFMQKEKSNAIGGTPKPAGATPSDNAASQDKAGGAIEFKPIGSATTPVIPQSTPNGLKLKSMNEVKSSIIGSTPGSTFKAEEFKLPSADALQNKINDGSNGIQFNLTSSNLIKFDSIQAKNEGLKRAKKDNDDDDEDLDDISLSEQDFQTQDQLL